MSLVLDPTLEPAVAEAKAWAALLHRAAYRGPGDTDDAIRHRLERETKVPASYLLRLHRRASSMVDVSRKYARLLRLAAERLERSAEYADAQRKAIHDQISARPLALAEGAGAPEGSAGPALHDTSERDPADEPDASA